MTNSSISLANGFEQEARKNPLIKRLRGKRYSCAAGAGGADAQRVSAELQPTGDMSLAGEPRARWGAMNDPMQGPTCPVDACLFVNLRGKATPPSLQPSPLEPAPPSPAGPTLSSQPPPWTLHTPSPSFLPAAPSPLSRRRWLTRMAPG